MDMNCNPNRNCNPANPNPANPNPAHPNPAHGSSDRRHPAIGQPPHQQHNGERPSAYSPGSSVRWDRVRDLRRQIAAGTYETEAKWVETLARLRQALAG